MFLPVLQMRRDMRALFPIPGHRISKLGKVISRVHQKPCDFPPELTPSFLENV